MKNDKCNLNETLIGDKSFYDSESSDESNMDKDETIEFPGGYQCKHSGEHRSVIKK